MTERRPPWFLLVGLLLVYPLVVVWVASWAFQGQPGDHTATHSPVALAATQPTTAQPMEGMVQSWAKALACREQALVVVGSADALRGSWTRHAGAHHDGMAGKISTERMRAVWKATLGERERQDPVYVQARNALVTSCKES